MTWNDVDLDRGTVSVTKSLEEVKGRLRVKEPKTEKARRTIVVSPFAIEALRGHEDAMRTEGVYRPTGPLFCGPRSGTWLRKSDVYRHSFKPILGVAKLTFKFHTLRHSCASYLLMSGADVKTVQERLGHSTPVMTLNTYSHVLSGAQTEAAKKLHAVFVAADRTPALGAA